MAFAGLAGFYLQLDAQFVGFAQILVYVGAVAILIVFAILLTRGAEIAVTVDFFALLGDKQCCLPRRLWSSGLDNSLQRGDSTLQYRHSPKSTVKQIGNALMSRFALPLEVIGLLLTAALIGAVTIAMHEKEEMK